MDAETRLGRTFAPPTLNLCASCDTKCCIDHAVQVNAHDVYRLTKRLRVPPLSFLRLVKRSDEKEGGVRLGRREFDLVLRSFSGRCAFLSENGKPGCTVYDFKPAVCSAYPFELDGKKISQKSTKACPSDWRTDPHFEAILRQQLIQHESEWAFYAKVVRDWNSRFMRKNGVIGLRGRLVPQRAALALSFPAFLKFLMAQVDNTGSICDVEAGVRG